MMSSSLSGNVDVDHSLSAISTILASQDKEGPRIRYVLSETPGSPSPILSTDSPTEFSGHSVGSVLSTLDSSQFLNTIPNSNSHGICEPFSTTFPVPEFSPLLLASQPLFAMPSHPVIPPLTSSYATESTPIPCVRDSSICSFIHFHGKPVGTGSVRRWTCNYCKLISPYTHCHFCKYL